MKWNDNKGGVHGAQGDVEQIAKEVREWQRANTRTLGYNDRWALRSKIIPEDVPQAFSHWTYVHSKSDLLVCDIQGQQANKFYLTDPAIHSRAEKGPYFGRTDHGIKGQQAFFKTHKCNNLCLVLGLR